MQELIAAKEAQAQAHEELRQTPEWRSARRRLDTITNGFLTGLQACWFAARRWPTYYDNTLTFRAMDDLLESAITSWAAIGNGALDPARRELRFVLESAINHLYVDEKLLRGADLEIKLAHPRAKNIDTVGAASELGLTIGRLYGRLSEVVHPTPAQFQARLSRSAQGNYIGFESLAELREIADLQLQVYDIALKCVFDALGPGLTGDLFIHVFDDLLWWPFHHAPLTYAISVGLNPKAERADQQAGPVRDRLQELLRVLEARQQMLSLEER